MTEKIVNFVENIKSVLFVFFGLLVILLIFAIGILLLPLLIAFSLILGVIALIGMIKEILDEKFFDIII